jgi:uncharacterized protein (DUF1501 family)
VKRNAFLLGAASGLALVGHSDGFFSRALAQSAAPNDDRVLVVVYFQGGNDVLRINDTVGLNPQLKPFKDMYDKGQVAIVQGVGYPNPDYSHFRSTEIYETATPDKYASTGWLGRYLDDANVPAQNLFNAVAIADVLPEVLVADRVDVAAIAQLNGYGLASDRSKTLGRDEFHTFVADNNVPFRSPYLAQVASIEDHAQRGAEELPKLVAGYKAEATYPETPIGHSLALAAQVIGSKLGTRVLYVQLGSFDTHTTQKATQDRLLADFANAISAFYADLAAHGDEGRVLTMTFSDFGRRVAENGSRGTDHGSAAPVFVIGGGVKGGLYGEHPSLDALDAGNMRFTTDFRSVYATVLEKWLQRPSSGIVGPGFAPLPLLA